MNLGGSSRSRSLARSLALADTEGCSDAKAAPGGKLGDCPFTHKANFALRAKGIDFPVHPSLRWNFFQSLSNTTPRSSRTHPEFAHAAKCGAKKRQHRHPWQRAINRGNERVTESGAGPDDADRLRCQACVVPRGHQPEGHLSCRGHRRWHVPHGIGRHRSVGRQAVSFGTLAPYPKRSTSRSHVSPKQRFLSSLSLLPRCLISGTICPITYTCARYGRDRHIEPSSVARV